MKRLYFALLFIVVLFSGCSTKEVFEPKKVAGVWKEEHTIASSIAQKASKVALLENGKIFDGLQTISLSIEKGFRLLGESSGYILTTNIDGVLRFYNKQKRVFEFTLKKTVATAATDGKVVAVVFADGDLALYDLFSQELLLKIDGTSSIALDARIVPPYFMNDLVLFMTLDGKIVIVNKKLKKKLRTILISSNEYFNNDIYFDIVQNRLIVATAAKILSFGTKQNRVEYEARAITHDKNYLYIATKQGDIIKLNPNLEFIGKAHFPFAHFLALLVENNNVYALEKEGYLIVLSPNLLTYKIYEVGNNEEATVFTANGTFYVNDKAIVVHGSKQ